MVENYQIEENQERIRVIDPISNYKLIIEKQSGHQQISFITPFPNNQMGEREMVVTGRDLLAYPNTKDIFDVNPRLQYVEIGPGLGGFIPYVVSQLVGTGAPLPIAIDPVNYFLLGRMLSFAKTDLGLWQEALDRIDVFLERQRCMINPSKVRLINKTLGQAFGVHPELDGIADVAVDNLGPSYHYHTEVYPEERFLSGEDGSSEVICLEMRLLKTQGKLFTASSDDPLRPCPFYTRRNLQRV